MTTQRILIGDVRERLRSLPDQSVHCVVTSPPYFGLRDYGVPGQIGLESTLAGYIATMVDVFREVWRVLRDDGTLWLNLGDSYSVQHVGRRDHGTGEPTSRLGPNRDGIPGGTEIVASGNRLAPGFKPKDLMGVPWRVAFALQDAGWYLRSDIIWHKPNPMPESATDRPTKSHEYLFLLTKRPRYFYDADAVRQPAKAPTQKMPDGWDTGPGAHGSFHRNGREKGAKTESRDEQMSVGANLRSVWTISTQAFPQAHFATFPTEIPRRAILAGTSEHGVCPACGAPWRRIVNRRLVPTKKAPKIFVIDNRDHNADRNDQGSNRQKDGHKSGHIHEVTTTGWEQTCTCDPAEPIPATVLDPFVGSGTTLMVANRLGRNGIGVELNPEYAQMAAERIKRDDALFVDITVEDA